MNVNGYGSYLWRRDYATYNKAEFNAAKKRGPVRVGNLYCCWAEGRRFDSLFGWLGATQHRGCNTRNELRGPGAEGCQKDIC